MKIREIIPINRERILQNSREVAGQREWEVGEEKLSEKSCKTTQKHNGQLSCINALVSSLLIFVVEVFPCSFL
jgi:hypothetical protein